MDKLRDFLKSWPGRIILILVLSPMALLGIESYIHGSVDPNEVVRVGDKSITSSELQAMITRQRKTILDSGVDASLIHEDVLQSQVLKSLVDRAMLEQQVNKLGLGVSDATITRLLQQNPNFLDADGNFSNQLFENFLRSQHMNKNQLFAQYRQQIVLDQLNRGIVNTAIYPISAVQRLIGLQMESREVWLKRFAWQDYQDKVRVLDSHIKDYYQQHHNDINSVETVDLSYIKITPQDYANVQVTKADIEQQYERYQQEYDANRQRHLSQILLTGKDAQARANQLKQRIDAGEDFAKLAKTSSDDPSGADGGAIGNFSRALFADDGDKVAKVLDGLAVGEVSEPVQTQFGYHLFVITSDNQPNMPSFQELRPKLEQQAKTYKAKMAYDDALIQINQLAADSYGINDIGKQLDIKVNHIKNYPKEDNQTALAQPVVIKTAFDEFALQDQSVSTSIELSDGVVWVQSSNHQPVKPLTLAQATPLIRQTLTQQKASELALADAKQLAVRINQSSTDLANMGLMALGDVTRQTPLLNVHEKQLAFSQGKSNIEQAQGLASQEQTNNDVMGVATMTDTGASVMALAPIQQTNVSQLGEEEMQAVVMNVRDNVGQDQMQDYLEYLRLNHKITYHDSVLKQLAH